MSYASLKRRVMAFGVIVLGFIHELESSEFSRKLGKLEDKLLRSSFLATAGRVL